MKHAAASLCLFLLLGCSKADRPREGSAEAPNTPPHARHLYFSDFDQLFQYDFDSGKVTFVFKGFDAVVSPDERSIAFTEDKGAIEKNDWTRHIGIYDIATKRTRMLRSIAGDNNFNAQWSPDGRTLVFDHWDSTSKNWFVARVAADDRDYRVISPTHINGISGYFQPQWRTDGSGYVCHDVDTAFEFTADGAPIGAIVLKSIVPTDTFGISSNSHIISDPLNHRLIVEAGSDIEEGEELEPYGIFVYDTQARRTTKVSPDSLDAWDPHWIASRGEIYFKGYTVADLRASNKMGPDATPQWKMFAVKPDGTGVRALFSSASLPK